MLFDPKWEVKADVFSLASLVAWLEKMPGDKEYCYMDNGNCLLGQYFRASGYNVRGVAGWYFRTEEEPHTHINFSDEFNEVAVGTPRTFGAALERARKLLP